MKALIGSLIGLLGIFLILNFLSAASGHPNDVVILLVTFSVSQLGIDESFAPLFSMFIFLLASVVSLVFFFVMIFFKQGDDKINKPPSP